MLTTKFNVVSPTPSPAAIPFEMLHLCCFCCHFATKLVSCSTKAREKSRERERENCDNRYDIIVNELLEI